MSKEFEYLFERLAVCEVKNKLRHIVDTALSKKYGNTLNELIVRRTEDEWEAMKRSAVFLDVAALYEVTIWLKKNGYPYWIPQAGSSFILYILGITMGNPLPAHYHCPVCQRIYWQHNCKDGFDLSRDNVCENCSALLLADGHDIPWQTLWGFGDFQANFEIELPINLFESFWKILASHWLQMPIADRFEIGPHKKVKCIRLSNLCLVFSLNIEKKEQDFYERNFTVSDVEYVIQHWKAMLHYLPEKKIKMPEPKCFADVVAISGLLRSSGGWDDVTAFMIYQMGYSLSDMIAFRDDIYQYLIDHGFLEKDAWQGANRVRTGRNLPVVTDEMRTARDKWVLNRCNKVDYLCHKAYAVEKLFYTLKLHDFST